MSADTDLATLREALAIGWPEGDHAEPHVFTEALGALARVRDSLERLQSLWLAERELRLAEQAAHRQTNEEAEALAEELERLQEPRDETGYPAWSGLPNDPLVRFTSASWHCPVCDRRGDVHDERCLVLELVTVARRRKDGNRRLVETNGRLRETAEAAEAELRECRDSFTEVERVAMRVVAAETEASRLREQLDALLVPSDGERIPAIVRTWERANAVMPPSVPTDPADPSTNLATLAAIAHAKWRSAEAAEARCARLQQALTLRRWAKGQTVTTPASEALALVEAELSRLRGLVEGSASDEAILQAAEARCARLRGKLEWVKHALPPSVSDELTEWLDEEAS